MDEQRVQAYLSLIQELLECPSGEEPQILNGHLELVDEGFVQVCELVAAQLQEDGQENKAGFVRNVAQQMGEFLRRGRAGENQQAVLQQFWLQLLQAERDGDTAAVHQVMRQNMGLIVPALGETITWWVQAVLAQNPDQAEGVTTLVVNTCTSMTDFLDGRYGEVLKIAIRGYHVVLALRTDNPKQQAQTLANLGNTYQTLAELGIDPPTNLKEAVAAYTEATAICRRPGLEKDMASALNNLGNVYLTQAQFGIDPPTNFREAIAAYTEATAIRCCLELGKDLSSTLNNLGIAYLTQAQFGFDPTANLEQAITTYTESADIRHRLRLTKDLADTLNNLGNTYLTQAQLGIDPTANLEQAITTYTESADIRRSPGLEKEFADTLNNLGNAYLTQAQLGIDPIANLKQAITIYTESADIRCRLGLEKDLSTTLNNLGATYQAQAELGLDTAINLQKAIAAYTQAVTICRRLELEKDLSSTLNNLGNAYQIQAEFGIDTAAYTKAITAYKKAAAIRYRLGLEKDLATTRNNLGNVYRIQAQFGIDPAVNLRKAIAAYRKSAAICRRLGLEKDLATTLNNLGLAYRTQAQFGIDPTANICRAIAELTDTAAIFRRLGLEKDLATTLNNLGNTYRTQAELGIDPTAKLGEAIAALTDTATIRVRLGLEKDFATTLNNLGLAYQTQAEFGIDPAANLDKAISVYNQAAAILRSPGLEKDLSSTLNNLGLAYQTQAKFSLNPAAQLGQAISAYTEAADILRRLGLVRDLAGILNNVGLAFQVQSRLADNKSPSQKQTALENAYSSFAEALEQLEYLRGEITTEDYKRQFNEEWNKVYRGMVEVCLELGRYTDALKYADRSKARNLVELIATRDTYPEGVIPAEKRQRLQYLKNAINQEDQRLQHLPNPDYTHIKQLRQEKLELEPYQPLHFQAMQKLLDEETAILEWYILPDKFLTFTLTPDSLNLWISSEKDRENLLDWANTYINDYRHNNNQWRDNLSQGLETLSQILHLDEILHNLRENFLNCQELILIPHLFLHLFPLHALPVTTGEGEGQLLQDLFPKGVAYAPNCQILQQAKKRINQRPHFNRLFAIQNPTQDDRIKFTDMEVEAIQSSFNSHQVLKHDEAEKAAINAETLKNAHCAHFSCHGYFNFQDALKSALILAKSEFTPPPPTDDPSRYLPLKDNKLLDLQKCLTLEDILRLDLTNCRLVTLSACETGITDFTSTSDEYIGLPSSFILAGSPNVVSTLWAVADISTAILMIHFYQTLQNQSDLSVVLALQQTQKWLREATVTDFVDWIDSCPVISQQRREQIKFTLQWGKKPESQPFSSPYYWAAFCAIGQ